jgi:hypothetical protein
MEGGSEGGREGGREGGGEGGSVHGLTTGQGHEEHEFVEEDEAKNEGGGSDVTVDGDVKQGEQGEQGEGGGVQEQRQSSVQEKEDGGTDDEKFDLRRDVERAYARPHVVVGPSHESQLYPVRHTPGERPHDNLHLPRTSITQEGNKTPPPSSTARMGSATR